MQFIVITILAIFILLFINFSRADSAEPQIFFNTNSAAVENTNPSIYYTEYREPVRPRDPRAIKLEKYLKGTKLAKHSDLIIDLSDKYGIDYKMVIAIAGLESGYCEQNFAANNCWGFGKYSWSSLETGLKEYFRLMKKNYFSKGLNTIEEISRVYAPSSTDYISKYYKHYNPIP